MESDTLQQCSFNFKEVLIDEIALQGLEGIGLDLLWKLVQKRMAAPITDKLIYRYWNFMLKNQELTFYKLPEPVPKIELIDRFSLVNPDSGIIAEHTDYLDGPYEYCRVENEYGSCKYYNTRVLISNEELAILPYDKVLSDYGDYLVIVASLPERWRALAPEASTSMLQQLTQIQYCILELIGRGRENGQCTVGKSNLLKIIKDPKLLFYNRNQLQKFHLIKSHGFIQFMDMKGANSILLRLTRFHEPLLLSMPKSGPFHDLISYLKNKPDYTECVETLVKKGVCDRKLIKRITKSARGTVFSYEDKSTLQMVGKPNSTKEKMVKRRYLRLVCPSDESSQSEDEDSDGSLACKFNVGVGLVRQAYEAFAGVGLKGLTQHQLAQLLGIGFYTARTICTIFHDRNLIRVFFEDKGRQRFKRYILVSQTNDMEEKIKHEKQKFLNYLECNKSSVKIESNEKENESDYEVLLKKVKIEESENSREHNVEDSNEKDFTEVKVLDGVEPESVGKLLSSMKSVTLRQLKFINGIITIIKREKVVSGYQPLSNLVAKETNEPPVATKALKVYVQRLVTEGQLKLLKMKWPGFTNKYTFLICDTDVKPNDPKLKAKYKEISVRIMNNKTHKLRDKSYIYTAEDLTQVSYPKYVRIQKLHELITTLVYFSNVKTTSDSPEGVSTLVHIIPEFTVQFALGNINHSSITKIDLAQITADLHSVKLRETPDDLYKQFLTCSSLQQCTRTNLKSLALLGLIQLIKEPSQTNEAARKCFTFYVNRNATLLDTSGTWPRKINENENIEKTYYFNTIEDVKRYWHDVYDISTKTTIEVHSRQSVTWLPPIRHINEVKDHDNGQLLGNGSGPCGFDSGFYLDAPRQWTTYYAKEKTKVPNINIHRLIHNTKVRKRSKGISKKAIKVALRLRRNKTDYEKSAQRVRSGTVKWKTEEDRILLYCKVAMGIISPVAQPTYSKIRNIVAKDILSLNDPKKIVSACQRRTAFVENKYSLEEECLLNELRSRKKQITEYDDLLKIFRTRDVSNVSKVISAARLPMMELVWFIMRLTKSKSYNKNTPCVASNIEDFHNKYTITRSLVNKSSTPVDPNNEICTISEFIMQTVSLLYKNTVSIEESEKIYNLFIRYPERYLRIALNHIRKIGAVAAVEKVTHSNLNRSGFEDVSRAKFRFSAAYQRKWSNRLHSDFMDYLMRLLDTDVSEISCKGTMELNCLACELQAKGVLEVAMVTIPVVSSSVPLINEAHFVNFIGEGEVKYKMKPGTCEIRNKSNARKFSELQEPIDYEKILYEFVRHYLVSISDTGFCPFFVRIYLDKHIALFTLTFVCKTAIFTLNDKNTVPNMNDEIIIHLKNKKEAGSTFRELQEIADYDYKTLNKKLDDMISKGEIFRVGYCENVFVLSEFLRPWTIENDGTLFIPKPWLSLNLKIRPNLLLKWACTVLNTVFMCPGSSLAYIADSCEFLVPTAVQDTCEFLEKCGCVKLNVLMTAEPDFFSEEETELVLEEYSANASVKEILVFPVPDCVTKLANVKRILHHLWYEP